MHIQRIWVYLMMSSLLIFSVSCLKVDNYEGPTASIQGSIRDKAGHPVYANAGNTSMRIKVLDYGYSENPSEYYLNVKLDGSYSNKQMFSSTYTLIPQGPFVPSKGKENVQLDGNVQVDFEVEPFFVVKWGEPALTSNGNGTITANVQISRGTDNPAYQQDISQVLLFISTTQYVGSNNYDQRLTPVISGAEAASFLDQPKAITSVTAGSASNPVSLKSGYTYYVRIGARSAMNGEMPEAYNFSDVQKITIP